jgi:Mor family transcriptional regulator
MGKSSPSEPERKRPSVRDVVMRPQQLKRRAKERSYILAQRASGRTLQSIGDEFGITRERVRQICVQEGWTRKQTKALVGATRHRVLELRKVGHDVHAIADELDLSPTYVGAICSAAGLSSTRQRLTQRNAQIVDRFKAGARIESLALEFNLHPTFVRKLLKRELKGKRLGPSGRKGKRLSRPQRLTRNAYIIKQFKSGQAITALAVEFDLSWTNTWQIAHRKRRAQP